MRLNKTRDRRSHQMKRERRNFSNDFKKQIVESIVSGTSTQAELAREHRISPVMISRWKKDYKAGKFFENVSSRDMAKLELRIRELERLAGRLTLENEMLKRARDLNTKEKKESSSIVTSQD
jgi:transposase-like protein